MGHVLLIGAGFSRNWGGWLASEAFEYLLGCTEFNEEIRNLLWSYRRKGGFEAALTHLQGDFARNPNPRNEERLKKFQSTISSMFSDMDLAFKQITDFEPQNQIAYLVRTFLVRFDAIFTLNQDLLMEHHYLNDNVKLSVFPEWNGWQIPGMRKLDSIALDPGTSKWSPLAVSEFKIKKGLQPFFKLHGSSNWIDENGGQELLVVGGDKASTIKRHEILEWNFDQFKNHLSRPKTKLMVIGYSFGDEHINKAISDAAEMDSLGIFIVDPMGVDVIDKNRDAQIYSPDPLFTRLQPHIFGASRRSILEIFGGDLAEHAKVMRFFDSF